MTSVTGEVVSVTSATGEVVSVTSATGEGARAPDANAMPQADAPAGAGTAPSEHEDAESEVEDNVVLVTSPSATAQGIDLPRTTDMPEWKQPTEQEVAAAPVGATGPNVGALPLTVYDSCHHGAADMAKVFHTKAPIIGASVTDRAHRRGTCMNQDDVGGKKAW